MISEPPDKPPVLETRIAPDYEQSLVNERVTEYLGWTVESLLAPVKDDDYGMEWPKESIQYIKELYAYSIGGLGGHSAFWHMINAIKLDLPHVILTHDGYINTTFLRVIDELCKEPDLAIAGAASSGKTFPVACFIHEDWKCAPALTLSFVCTTSLGASEDRIWGAIVGLWQRAVYKCGEYIAHKYVIVWGKFSDDASDREYNAAIKALAIEKGEEGKKAIDTTRGRKQRRVRIVYDELPEMGNYATQATVNLESNPELRATYIGNPNRHDDAHGDVCRPDHPLGFKSINTNTPKWKTRTGAAIFMHGEWSPNFQAPADTPIPFPYLTNRITLKRMLKRCHGNRNSIEYHRNAIGFWPDASVTDTVLTAEIIEQFGGNLRHKWRSVQKRLKVCGFDPAFGRGGDLCAAQFGEIGITLDNRKIIQWHKEKIYFAPAKGIFEEEIAKMLVDDCIAEGVTPDCLGLDISGDGGKILREVIRYWLLKGDRRAANVHAISSMGKPSDRQVSSVDPRKCSDVFDRRVTEYWMMVREGVMTRTICGLPLVVGEENELIDELCARTYEIWNKKFKIEKKEEMKDRIKKSPDRADAFAYMIEIARRHGLVFVSPDDEERRDARKRERSETERDPESRNYGSDSWGEGEDEEAA